MANTINIKVEGHRLTTDYKGNLAVGSNNFDQLCFTLTGTEWTGYTLYAVVYQDVRYAVKIKLDTANKCTIPLAALSTRGTVFIGLRGEKADESIGTSNMLTFNAPNGAVDGEVGLTPSQYAAIIDRLTNLENGGLFMDWEKDLKANLNKSMNDAIAQMELKGDEILAKLQGFDEADITSFMQKTIYDPDGKGSQPGYGDIYEYARNIAAAYSNTVQSAVDSLRTTVGQNTTNVNAAAKAISDALSLAFADNMGNTNTSTYATLKAALEGVYGKSRAYVETALQLYKSFTVEIVNSIDFDTPGEERKFYLLPNESGTGYDKYWYITDEATGQAKWDSFGSTNTLIVDALPEVGDSNSDYILNTGSGYAYYKYIGGKWQVIAGGMVQYVDELPETGNALADYYVKNEAGTYVHYRWINGEFVPVGSDSYSKEELDRKLANIVATNNTLSQMLDDIANNKTNISSLNATASRLQRELQELDTEGNSYDCDYDSLTGEFRFFENGEVIRSFTIQGGGPGTGGSATTLVVDKITPSPMVLTTTDKAIIEIDYSSKDSDGSDVDGSYVLKLGSAIVASGTLMQGRNTFDVTNSVSVGTQKFTLTVTDEGGSVSVKTWTVQVVDVRLESNFSDRYTNAAGRTVSFTYTPYGSVSKTVHFMLDGEDIGTVTTSASGTLQSFAIAPQPHGSHLLEVWMTANVGGAQIETEHIFKDIIWYDETSKTPVIACIYRYEHYGYVDARQYDTTAIVFNIYDPNTSAPKISRTIDGVPAGNNVVENNQFVWNFKSSEIKKHTLTLACGTTTATVRVDVHELGIDVSPISGNLELDFNPSGMSNTSADRIWSNGTYHMSVSENFDWNNGGYKTDEEGNDYFLVKAGTRATFDYLMFGGGLNGNPSVIGTEMKLIFQTEKVQDADAVWFTNAEQTVVTANGAESTTDMGIQLSVHSGWLKTNNALNSGEETDTGVAATNTYLYMPWSEEDRIELDINIDTIDRDASGANAFVMAYEDGVPSKAFVYDATDRFYQYTPKPIVIGSDQCDVRIYRMKIYSASLTDENVMRNFIADSLDSDTMLSRYDRNSIYYNPETGKFTPYSSEGNLSPERLAEACPGLKILKLDCPTFTKNKKTFVKATLECIHKGGDPILDNWKFFNGYHSGQGTTSDNYGASGRNVDFLFNADGIHKVSDKVDVEEGYRSYLVTGYNTENAVRYDCVNGCDIHDPCRITLTRGSFPANYLNLKVNIASSENANNALLQKRYNDYLPYVSPAVRRDPRLKNDMEFVPAVLFIREYSETDEHQEFQDTNWHFYALGNIGDSKKTDYTRAYDPQDMNEFVIEISDNTKNNATFQTGVYMEGGRRVVESVSDTEAHTYVYPITSAEWTAANKRYSTLYNEAFDGDHSFEPRYACCGDYRDGKFVTSMDGIRTKDTDAVQLAKNEGVWRAFYRWVITSSDAEFKAQLGEWVVESAVKFFYAYTHNWTMMDNRAKNTFWHWAKTGTYRPVSNPVRELLHLYHELQPDGSYKPTEDTSVNGYKTYYTEYAFDLWDYDNDTALGINNNGELIFPYGKEDIDFNTDGDSASGYVFNGAASVFWCRLRDLCGSDIQAVYNATSSRCWSAEDLISEFDAYQECYPEEVWRLDIQRKYMRTYTGAVLDNSIPKKDISYLRDMMQGRKKYQRRQWVRDQEIYFATKMLNSSVTGSNYILFRCNTPVGKTIAVPPDYTLKITPYSDMYVSVMFGNGGTTQVRAKGGQEYVIECPLAQMDDTQVVIYGASRIAALNDISACYIHANNFSMATKLRKLVIGNPTKGYNNSFLTTLNMGNNYLLEELDLRNCGNLSGSLDLSQCNNLLRLYAEGSAITGVTFATNGNVELAHLPDTINTLIMRNLNNLTDLQATLNRLESLTLQGGTIDSKALITTVIDTLQVLYLYDIDWELTDTSLLNELQKLFFSLITGYVYVAGSTRQRELDAYAAAWPDLEVGYDTAAFVNQFPITAYDSDKSTVLDTIYVDQASPINQDDLPVPVKAPDAQYVYTFDKWTFDDGTAVNFGTYRVTSEANIYASYKTETRSYTVKWYSYGSRLLDEQTVPYGSAAVYSGPTPERTDGEASYIYHLFDGWDKFTGFVTEDLSVNAKWQIANGLPAVGTDMKDMSIAQIYAIAKTNKASQYFEMKDYFEFNTGYDVDYSNLRADVIVGEKTHFDGHTAIDTGIKLMQNNEAWTIAIESEWDSDYSSNTNGALLSAFDGGSYDGFELLYNGYPRIQWGTSSIQTGYQNYRSLTVLRHEKGSNHCTAYIFDASNSNMYSQSISIQQLTKSRSTQTDASIILGARKDVITGNYINYGKGTIHWCKLWHADLGDDTCKKLAAWTHELIRMEYCGANRYTYADNTGYTKMSFISNSLLDKLGRHRTSNTNTGGYPASDQLRPIFQRFYEGLPDLIKSIIRPIKCNSSAGNTSYEVISSTEYCYPPATAEMSVRSDEPYIYEGSHIPWFTSDILRAKFRGVIVPEDAKYYTNAANSDPAAVNAVKEGDVWKQGSGTVYVWHNGAWFTANYFWLRSPLVSSTTNFWYVSNNGSVTNYYASNANAVCPCFSV